MHTYNKNLYPFRPQWVNIDGHEIHYIDEGEGPVILFCHPPVASSFMYREFFKYLRQHFRCVALDFPGFGLSVAHSTYSFGIESQKEVLQKFIQILDLRDIFLIGHDTGGPSAFGVAIQKPHLFNGLILTDTLIYPVSEYKKLTKMLKLVGGRFFSWFNASTNFLVNGTTKYGIRTRKLTREERSQYKDLFNSPEKRRHVTEMLFSLYQSESYMKTIKRGFESVLNSKPTLLIYGEKDPVNVLGIASRIHQLLPNSEFFQIESEGHFPHEGQPEQMSLIIHEWIEKTISRSSSTQEVVA